MKNMKYELENKLINYLKEHKGTVFVVILILALINNKDNLLAVLFSPAMIMFIISCIYIMYTRRSAKVKISKDLDFSKSIRTLPSYNNIEFYREIPCERNIEKAYWILYHYTKIEERKLKYGIIGAYILKWIKEKHITVIKNVMDNNYKIDLGSKEWEKSKPENELYLLLQTASLNNILEKNELKEWYKKNYKYLDKWFNEFIENETMKLREEGLIKENIVSEELRNEAIKLVGLKKFLLNFTLISGRNYKEIELWEEYLIFAQLLGIANKVNKQFSTLYPDFSVISESVNILNKEFPSVFFNVFMIFYFGFALLAFIFLLVALILI